MKVKSISQIHHETPIPVYDVINSRPFHNFVIEGGHVLHNCAAMDEINFQRTGIKDINKAKANMRDTYNTVVARVKGTFRQEGQVVGKIFAVSSKKSDSDFMESYIQEQIASGAEEWMYISDAPQWEVLPDSMFKSEKFYIAVGDRYKKGFVVPDNQAFPEAISELEDQGYMMLNPPIDVKSNFLADFDIALRDIAGISVPGALSFITQASIDACIDKSRRNPFYSDILSIGTKDGLVIEDFFHMNEIPAECFKSPMFIHLDLSKNTDRTGISGVCLTGRKDVEGGDGNKISHPMFTHVFSIALEAPRGDKIPYQKITEFICWLRKQGLNISGISRDQFQSEYMAQLLEDQGFNVDLISLDRTPDGYMAAKSIILEERVDMLDCKLLQDELIHLQRDSITGKLDHPVGGGKDVSDSFAGALWNAVKSNPGVPVPVSTVSSVIADINGRRSPSQTGMFPGLIRR